MKYIVCVTNFHILVAKAICQEWCPNTYRIVDLRRKGHIGEWRTWFKAHCNGVVKLAQCVFDRKSHAIVAHPYNFWFSIFIRAGRKSSIYDDGVAYYNNSRVPSSFRANVYSFLSGKVIPLLSKGSQEFGYVDILKSAKIERYYCLYPELFLEENFLFSYKIKRIKLVGSEGAKGVSLESMPLSSGVAVFLDSVPGVVARYDSIAIFKYLESKYSTSSVKFYYKPHPSRPTSLSVLFSNADWASNIVGGFEEFAARRDVLDLYSFYSSASIIARVYSKRTNIYCFSNANTAALFVGVVPLMRALGAEVLCVDS